MTHEHSLSNLVYSEPTGRHLRPHLVDYVKYYAGKAKQLTEDELLHGKGSNFASDICGALSWQGANDAQDDAWITDWISRYDKKSTKPTIDSISWITEKDEPILWKILEVSSPLDVDSNDSKKWRELFELADKL